MKLNRKSGLTAGVLAAVTMLIAPAAFATNTLSVDGVTSPAADVNVTATNSSSVSFVTNAPTPVPVTCASGSLAGYAKRGASVTSGQKLGAVTQFALGATGTPCLATGFLYPVRVDNNPGGVEWPIIATATPGKGAASVPVRIDNIDMKMRSISKTGTPAAYICDLRIRGTLTGSFDQTTQRLTINPPNGTFPLSNITAYDGNGTDTIGSGMTCGGEIWTGDGTRMRGVFSLSTPLGGGIHW